MLGDAATRSCRPGGSAQPARYLQGALLPVILLSATHAFAAPATPADFGQNPDQLNLNALTPGGSLAAQLRVAGLHVRADEGAIPLLVNQATAGMELPSEPVAVQPSAPGAGIELQFLTPKKAVGFRYLVPAGEQLVLLAYDGQGNLIDQVVVTGKASPHLPRAVSPADFAGLVQPLPTISRVRVFPANQASRPVIDDILLAPSQASSVDIGQEQANLGPFGKQADKLDAIVSLLLKPGPATTALLLQVAETDPDPYVREQALLALAQHWDVTALPRLVSIALNDKDRHVGSAARNAVFELRKQWPLPDPPEVSFTASGPFQPGQPFVARIKVTSPVDRDPVVVLHEFRGDLLPAPGNPYRARKVTLKANDPFIWDLPLVAPAAGRYEVEAVVTVSPDTVDVQSYRRQLYIEIDGHGGSASSQLFPDLPPPGEYELPGGNQP